MPQQSRERSRVVAAAKGALTAPGCAASTLARVGRQHRQLERTVVAGIKPRERLAMYRRRPAGSPQRPEWGTARQPRDPGAGRLFSVV